MPHSDPWLTHRTKDLALANITGGQTACRLWPSLEAERQVCNSQRWKVRGCWNLGPRDCTLLPSGEWAASHYLHLPGILDASDLPGVLQIENSSLEETHSPPGTVILCHIQEPTWLGPEMCKPPWAMATLLWSIHCASSPHTPTKFVFSVPPSQHHNWTNENK